MKEGVLLFGYSEKLSEFGKKRERVRQSVKR